MFSLCARHYIEKGIFFIFFSFYSTMIESWASGGYPLTRGLATFSKRKNMRDTIQQEFLIVEKKPLDNIYRNTYTQCLPP